MPIVAEAVSVLLDADVMALLSVAADNVSTADADSIRLATFAGSSTTPQLADFTVVLSEAPNSCDLGRCSWCCSVAQFGVRVTFNGRLITFCIISMSVHIVAAAHGWPWAKAAQSPISRRPFILNEQLMELHSSSKNFQWLWARDIHTVNFC